MFVRWKTVKRANGNVMHTAQLVAAARMEGKPRQKVIAHLGSYTERPPATVPSARAANGETPIYRDMDVWGKVEARADFWELYDVRYVKAVPEDLQNKIEAALASRVPRLQQGERTNDPRFYRSVQGPQRRY